MKAVYYICNNPKFGPVAHKIWTLLEKDGFFKEKTDIKFFGQDVMKYTDNKHEYYFVPTDKAICVDYNHFLPEMNKYFSNFDMSAMVTWHEGEHAPNDVLTVHSLGDVNSGVFSKIKPRFMRNLMMSYNKNKIDLGLEKYHVVTEATHWSGVHNGEGNPNLLLEYPVPMVDIEVGSCPDNWEDETACLALARSLTHVFDDDNLKVHNILCVGGVHFEPNFAEAVFNVWGNETFGVTHILANQWLVSGNYQEESGFERACKCIDSIEGGVEAIFFHDKLKGCYKDLVRNLGAKYNIPIYKHQKLRKPEDLEW